MRAVADDPALAASSGINVEQIRMLSWFIGGGLAGLAGAFWAGSFRFFPETGSTFLLAAFAVIVLGSIGSFEGAIVAALIIAFFRNATEPVLAGIADPLNRNAASTYVQIIPYIILITVLIFYPKCIGNEIEQKRLNKARKKAWKDQNGDEL